MYVAITGLFVRRLVLAFELLTFQEVTKVFKAFCSFVDDWQRNSQVSECFTFCCSTDQ